MVKILLGCLTLTLYKYMYLNLNANIIFRQYVIKCTFTAHFFLLISFVCLYNFTIINYMHIRTDTCTWKSLARWWLLNFEIFRMFCCYWTLYNKGVVKGPTVLFDFAGQQRSRMLATLFKDERCTQLPAYNILEKM